MGMEGMGKSIGMAIDGFGRLRLRCWSAARTTIIAPEPLQESVSDYLRKWRQLFNDTQAVGIEVVAHPPMHSGLGSGTQLAVSLAYALGELTGAASHDPNHDQRRALKEAAIKLGRLKRSVVGLNAWLDGGFIIGDRRAVARYEVASDWRVLLIIDSQKAGLSGRAEERAFAALPNFDASPRLAKIVSDRLPRALKTTDFASFAEAISELQEAMGRVFAGSQGGNFSSSRIAEAVRLLPRLGVGQSSWGPIAFAFFADASAALSARARLDAQRLGLKSVVVRADNQGAIIKSVA